MEERSCGGGWGCDGGRRGGATYSAGWWGLPERETSTEPCAMHAELPDRRRRAPTEPSDARLNLSASGCCRKWPTRGALRPGERGRAGTCPRPPTSVSTDPPPCTCTLPRRPSVLTIKCPRSGPEYAQADRCEPVQPPGLYNSYDAIAQSGASSKSGGESVWRGLKWADCGLSICCWGRMEQP